MAKYKYNISEPMPALLEERKSLYGLRTYISLFSSAGVGCYGFKQENYHCIATVEVRRIFPKILNVFAVEHQIPGSERGHISTYDYTFADLMYNRKNWRDLNK